MATFLVLSAKSPKITSDPSREVAFVRDGFSLAAFLFTPVWLLMRRLWLALAVWIAAVVVMAGAVGWGVIPLSAAIVMYLLMCVFFALETGAATWARSHASNGLEDLVLGKSREQAMQIYFARRLASGSPDFVNQETMP